MSPADVIICSHNFNLSHRKASVCWLLVVAHPCMSLRQETVAGLLKNMFEGERSETSIVNGTQVLLTLLETRRSG